MAYFGLAAIAVVVIILVNVSNNIGSNNTPDSAVVATATEVPKTTTTVAPTPTATATVSATIMSTTGGFDFADRAVLRDGPMPCFESTDALGDWLRALAADDKAGQQQAEQLATILFPGDSVLVIDSSMSPFGTGALRFRVTDGPRAGAACWLPGSLPMRAFAHVARAPAKS